MERLSKLTLMNDLLEHMGDCCDRWQAADQRTQRYWEESMRNDLAEFRRLCAAVREETTSEKATAAC